MTNVYYAGKIEKNCWRHALYPELRMYTIYDILRSEERLAYKNLIYTGPYFIGCDHGCFHGDGTHGVNMNGVSLCADESIGKKKTVEYCFNFIDDADVVFCYLYDTDAYGTYIELGYAKAKNKKIYMVLDSGLDKEHIKDIWFMLEMADEVVITDDLKEAHENFINWVKKLKITSKKYFTTNQITNAQLKFLQHLAKKENKNLKDIETISKLDANYLIQYFTGQLTELSDDLKQYILD